MEEKLLDIGSERAILASLCQHGIDAYISISDIIDIDSFVNTNNKLVFECLSYVINNDQKPDIASLLSAAEQLNISESINTPQELKYISSLYEFPVEQTNTIKFATQLKKFEYARKIKKLTSQINRKADKVTGKESIDEIINILESPVTDFLREDSGTENPEQIGEGVEDYVEFLKENKCDIIGIPTGFTRYDEAIGGGLRRKCVDLVSARPKVGKSVFADNVALNVASSGGIPVLVLDTEMSKEDHLNRLISNISGVPINEVATGKFVDDPNKENKVHEAEAENLLSKIPYSYISVAGKPFEQIT